MSYEVILLTDEQDLKIDRYGLDFKNDGNDFYHTSGEKFLNVNKDDNVFSYYEKDEIELIKTCLQKPSVYVIDTNSFYMLKTFPERVPDEIKLLVDNDHGYIGPKESISQCNDFAEFFKLRNI